uniref:SRCR domain-containing protein n=1 Tax=Cyprinus carpio TaxID=7962 RepID=A0A8C1XU96_CYPCA
MFLLFNVFSSLMLSFQYTDRVNVRLVGGHSRCAGRVEVLHRGQWGTVCGDGWDLADAAVVCRELDCGEPVDALGDARFGPESKPVWMSTVMCTGSEAVVLMEMLQSSAQVNCFKLILSVRLVGGSRCSGRLEILHNQTWMSVCDAAFDQQDAEVVCRELDSGAPVQVLGAAAFDKGDTQMWTQEIQCRGNESQIHLCPASPSHENNCSHDNDVGLMCTDRLNVRLVNGSSRCAGRVEVLHRGQWGTVCGDGWDLADAAVVCRELDCGDPVDALGDAHFGPESKPVWMSIVMCTGSESTLKNCGSVGQGGPGCGPNGDATVICSGKLLQTFKFVRIKFVRKTHMSTTFINLVFILCIQHTIFYHIKFLYFVSHFFVISTFLSFCPSIFLCFIIFLQYTDRVNVRLVNGSSRCAGRVEVLHRGQWGTVCGDFWDMADAAVVCRELDCGEPVDALSDAHFGPGSGPIWMSYVFCTGSESTLKNCGSSGWGKRACDHTKDVGVICSGE